MEASAREAAVVSVVDGTEDARRILVADHLTLGRGDDAGLVIDDPEISREHAVIAQTPDGLEIRDLSSLNGTWVNGERIGGTTSLVPGDVVKIGKTRIEVLAAGGPGLAPAARASPTPVEAEDEVRPVSVLFADVVGSTPLAERLEPGDYAALMGGCVDRMCRAVEQFGGVIDAYMGDGIAAFFGFPCGDRRRCGPRGERCPERRRRARSVRRGGAHDVGFGGSQGSRRREQRPGRDRCRRRCRTSSGRPR